MTEKINLVNPPSRFDIANFFYATFFVAMGVFAIVRNNWIGAGLNFCLLGLIVYFMIWQYKSASSLRRKFHILKTMQEILDTPVFREEGRSVIITIVTPQPHILKDFEDMPPKGSKNGKNP